MTKATYKRIFNWVLAYIFKGRVCDCHGGKCGSRQPLEQYLKNMYSDLQVGCRESETGPGVGL